MLDLWVPRGDRLGVSGDATGTQCSELSGDDEVARGNETLPFDVVLVVLRECPEPVCASTRSAVALVSGVPLQQQFHLALRPVEEGESSERLMKFFGDEADLFRRFAMFDVSQPKSSCQRGGRDGDALYALGPMADLLAHPFRQGCAAVEGWYGRYVMGSRHDVGAHEGDPDGTDPVQNSFVGKGRVGVCKSDVSEGDCARWQKCVRQVLMSVKTHGRNLEPSETAQRPSSAPLVRRGEPDTPMAS